jgi:hypothetical protein
MRMINTQRTLCCTRTHGKSIFGLSRKVVTVHLLCVTAGTEGVRVPALEACRIAAKAALVSVKLRRVFLAPQRLGSRAIVAKPFTRLIPFSAHDQTSKISARQKTCQNEKKKRSLNNLTGCCTCDKCSKNKVSSRIPPGKRRVPSQKKQKKFENFRAFSQAFPSFRLLASVLPRQDA